MLHAFDNDDSQGRYQPSDTKGKANTLLYHSLFLIYATKQLEILARLTVQNYIVRNAKPHEVENEFSNVSINDSGELILQNSRFKNRVRSSQQVSGKNPCHFCVLNFVPDINHTDKFRRK